MPSVAMWFGLLRAFPVGGEVAARELPGQTRLSKRAVRQLLGAATRSHWIRVRSGAGVQTVLGLTGSGQKAAAWWAAAADATDCRWCERVGADPGSLRTVLAALVGQLDLELPHYPISYGSADSRVTGGRFRPARSGPPRIPAHGQDWAPVLRGDEDTVSMLALTPLLSQLLVAFMVDYADAGGGALVVAEGLARGFAKRNNVPVNDVPAVLGVNGSGRSGLERHGLVTVRPDPDGGAIKVAHLSMTGQRARDAYAVLVRNVESDWAARFGASAIAAVRDALESTLAAIDPALPDALIATYVQS
jgi:hypothetical protein